MLALGFSAVITDRTLAKLRSLNYVDDNAFARGWARGRAQNLGYGPRRIRHELRDKGIPPSLIAEAMREVFQPGAEKAQANTLIEKTFRGKDLENPKILRRAIGFLQRRGYASGVIAEVLRRPPESD